MLCYQNPRYRVTDDHTRSCRKCLGKFARRFLPLRGRWAAKPTRTRELMKGLLQTNRFCMSIKIFDMYIKWRKMCKTVITVITVITLGDYAVRGRGHDVSCSKRMHCLRVVERNRRTRCPLMANVITRIFASKQMARSRLSSERHNTRKRPRNAETR